MAEPARGEPRRSSPLHCERQGQGRGADPRCEPLTERQRPRDHQRGRVAELGGRARATDDLQLGDITSTRRGVAVAGDRALSLGVAASPKHHELAQRFTFGDNFFPEPTVSSDGRRWLTNN
jgi:hypothetical protein